MKVVVPGASIRECQKKVDAKKKSGWKPITDIKLDNSGSGDIRYVCVMELKEQAHGTNQSHWRTGFNRA
jgi:hypothetical protein